MEDAGRRLAVGYEQPLYAQAVTNAAAVQLRTRLANSAGHHARTALKAYQQASYPDFYLHAGTALELAIKARLAGDHGVHCLAPDGKGWFATMLQISRDLDGKQGQRPRTVEAAEALRRLQALEPELPDVFGQNVAQTLDRRNVGAHAGHGAAPSDSDFLSHAAAFVRAVSLLLRQSDDAFWGELSGLAASLVEKELNAVRVRVRAALAHSVEVKRAMPSEAFSALEAATVSALEEEGPDVVGVECPGCGAIGWGIGSIVDEGEAEAEADDGGILWHWLPALYLVLEEFICRTCELDLIGQEEIKEAGLPSKVPNERASPSDAIDFSDL